MAKLHNFFYFFQIESHCSEFSNDTSFLSEVIDILINVSLLLSNPLRGWLECSTFFLIIIGIHSPENLSALVWFYSGEKLRASSQKYGFQKIQNTWKICLAHNLIWILSGVSQRFQKTWDTWACDWRFRSYKQFCTFDCCSTPIRPIGVSLCNNVVGVSTTLPPSFKSLQLTVLSARSVLRGDHWSVTILTLTIGF